MRRLSFLLTAILIVSGTPTYVVAADHLLISEFCVTLTAGEFVEIYNPTSSPIDLSNYYLTDATYAPGGYYYYNIVLQNGTSGSWTYDFNARFPDGASILSGEHQTIAMKNSGFNATYGVDATYELNNTDASVPDMREAEEGSIGDDASLTNTGEVLILYYWDGNSDLIQDIDYVLWGDKNEAVYKTGIVIDGIDADTDSSAYLNDTPIDSQTVVNADNDGDDYPHDVGKSAQRSTIDECDENAIGGNGITGHDETSEDMTYAGGCWTLHAMPTPGYGHFAPRILLTTPGQNELNVAVNTNISVTFNADMDETTINDSTFVVNARSTGLHQGTINYNSGTKTATFDPTEDFDVGEIGTVMLTTGIQSSQGVPLDSSYVWSFTIMAIDGAGTFVPDSAYPVGDYPYSIFAADLDSDGDLDLATANFISENVSVLLNNGDGTFSSHSVYAVGDGPISVFAADLDGDGDLDLTTGNVNSNNVSVLLNNGDGTFGSHSVYAVGDGPSSVFAANLDGDSDLDLAVANQLSHNVSVLLNNGDATFGPDSTYPVGYGPIIVFAADLDGDGDLDLTTANYGSDDISVLLNNGDATFGPHLVYPVYPVGDGPISVFAADLDGDGDLDLTTANANSDNVSVLLNNGDGTFASQSTYPVHHLPRSVFASDLDGDGDLDLVTANKSSDDVSVLLNNGDGTFAPQSVYSVSDGPQSVFVADLDGDSDLDLVTANIFSHDVSVLLNQENQTPLLSWTGNPDYENDGVSPETGNPITRFDYRIKYTDADNDPPALGFPQVHIDANGDGDFADTNEGVYPMAQLDPLDTLYSDGKVYTFLTYLPPGTNYQYKFSAQDTFGAVADGDTSLTQGPDVSSEIVDLCVYASDIEFSGDSTKFDEGEVFTIYAQIDNHSNVPKDNVMVVIYEHETVIDTLYIDHMESWSSATVALDHSINQMGFYPIKVDVDPGNQIAEWNEFNNSAQRPVIIGDYSLPGGIVFENSVTSPVCPGGWATASSHAEYYDSEGGPVDGMWVRGATVTVTVEATGRQFIGYTNDNGDYAVGFTAPGQLGWHDMTVEITDYTLTAQVGDCFQVVSCEGGGDGDGWWDGDGHGGDPCEAYDAPDLAISISVSGLPAIEGNTLTVDGYIRNVGTQPGSPVVVHLLKDGAVYHTYDLGIDTLYPQKSAPLPPVDVSFDSPGNHCLTGWIVSVAGEMCLYNNFSTMCFQVWPDCTDLVPTDISFSDQTPETDSTIAITGRVENRGGLPATDPFICDFSANGEWMGSDTIPSLGAFGAVTYVDVAQSFPQETTYTVLLEVDTQHHISECDENNNTYQEEIFVHDPRPDFQVDYYDLTTSNTYPDSGGSIYLQAYVHNQGEVTGDSVWVRFLLDTLALGNDVKIQVEVDSSFFVQSTQQWEVDFQPHPIKVFVDPESLVAEVSKNNNLATCPLPADLKPLHQSETPRQLYVDQEDTLQGFVVNLGGFDVLDTVQIAFYDTLIVDDTIRTWMSTNTMQVDSLFNHQKDTADVRVHYAFTTPGLHQVTIFADAGEEIPEYSEVNNFFSFYVTVLESLPDLMIHSEYIAPTDINPDSGELVYANITVHNIGIKPATDIWVKVMIDTNYLDLRHIDSIPAAAAADSYRTIDSVGPWVATDSLTHTHVFWVIVDPDSLIAELDEDNNEATRAIIVGGCPDLFADTLFPFGQWFGQTIAKARIRNNGGEDAFAQVGFLYIDGGDTISVGYDDVYVPAFGGADTASVIWDQDTVGTALIVISNCVPFDCHPENDTSDWSISVGVEQEEPQPLLPETYSLSQNYPNPFNPITQIKYALPKDCDVKLTIFNILGQRVITLVNESQRAGYKIVRWDSRSQSGNEVGSGIYFYRLQAGDFVQTRKMVLLR